MQTCLWSLIPILVFVVVSSFNFQYSIQTFFKWYMASYKELCVSWFILTSLFFLICLYAEDSRRGCIKDHGAGTQNSFTWGSLSFQSFLCNKFHDFLVFKMIWGKFNKLLCSRLNVDLWTKSCKKWRPVLVVGRRNQMMKQTKICRWKINTSY